MSPEEKQVRVGTAGHTPTVGCGGAHPASNPAGQLAWIGARSGPGAQRASIDRTSVVPPGALDHRGYHMLSGTAIQSRANQVRALI